MKYSEYKDSRSTWMGSIPSHWKLERAKWSFTLRNERGNAEPVLLAATQKYGMYPQDLIEGVVKVAEGTDVQQFRTVHKDDFVISLRSFQGGFERSDYEGVCSPAYQVFYANNRWDTNYLKFLFKNELFIDAMNALTVGIREGRNIKYEDFANSVLAIPPISEQRSIAAFLDSKITHIDSVIAEAKASIEEYKAWKASIIYEAVTKGLDPDVEMKDSGYEWIGSIPAHWEVSKIGRFVSIRSGITLGKTYPKDTELLELPYLRVANVKADGFALDDVATLQVTEAEAQKYALKNGELLMTEGGDRDKLGRGTIWHEEISPCLHQNHVFSVTCDEEWLLTQFLAYLTASPVGREYFDLTAKKTTNLASTNSNTILQFRIPVPDTDEQQRIVDYLNNKCKVITDLIIEKETLLTDLEAYKKSLIFEVVTGKRRVC